MADVLTSAEKLDRMSRSRPDVRVVARLTVDT